MTIENIMGDLRDGYNQLRAGTFRHADQLTYQRMTNTELQTKLFHTADGPLYSLEGKKKVPTLWLTREADNLVLRHLNDEVNSSYDQLVKNGNFRPNAEEAREAMESKDALRIDLTNILLCSVSGKRDEEVLYVPISTANYHKLNSEERRLAERFYGPGKRFVEAMKALKKAGINATKVYILNPDYVQKKAQKGPLARASWLTGFAGNSNANASSNNVFKYTFLRGVPRVVHQGIQAPEIF